MSVDLSSEVTFAAGEARVEVFAGMGGLLYGGVLLLLNGEYWEAAGVIVGFGAYLLWRGARAWGKPYVLLSQDRLVVFDRGRPRHYVAFAAIAAIQRSFNRTRLLMRDGLKIHVSHLGFVSKDEVKRFTEELVKRVNAGRALDAGAAG